MESKIDLVFKSESGTTRITSTFGKPSGIDESVASRRVDSLKDTITIESPGERLVSKMVIPVLLLAYKRPKNTREIIESLAPDSKVYIFVDHDNAMNSLNEQVKDYVENLSTSNRINSRIIKRNLGPGKAMIQALDWVFQSEEMVWVLEDDVFPNEFASRYVDATSETIRLHRRLMATTRSPIREISPQGPCQTGVSSFALTNGWIVTKEIWLDFKNHLDKKLLFEFLKFIIRNPFELRIAHFYIYGGAVICRSGLVPAWDTQFLFFCLIQKVKTITPNKSCIEIRGVDSVASNTVALSGNKSEVFWKADNVAPATEVYFEKSTKNYYDQLISREIYGVRWWHIFSPVKSYLRVIKKRIV